jgi:hypothetical protein
MQTQYGCYNKQLANGYYVMQRRYTGFGQYIMEPTFIKHTMTTDCQWSKIHVSELCKGCVRLAIPELKT